MRNFYLIWPFLGLLVVIFLGFYLGSNLCASFFDHLEKQAQANKTCLNLELDIDKTDILPKPFTIINDYETKKARKELEILLANSKLSLCDKGKDIYVTWIVLVNQINFKNEFTDLNKRHMDKIVETFIKHCKECDNCFGKAKKQ